MILQKYRRQFSDNAIALAHGSNPFFVPSSFRHKDIDKNFVDIDIPQWFLDKHTETLKGIEFSTNLLIKSLCDLD